MRCLVLSEPASQAGAGSKKFFQCRLMWKEPKQRWRNCQVHATHTSTLSHDSGNKVTVFGVEHLQRNVEVAEFIMNSKPGIVVVETSVNPSHGSKVGQTLTVDDMPQDDITNVFQQFGRMLAVERFPARSQIWQQLKPSCGEQLVYIAAFAVSAKIVYGDRVKADVYKRLSAISSLAELDHAFGTQCWLNFEELLDGDKNEPLSEMQMGAVDRIMLTEREACLCHTLDTAAKSESKGVVGVFGAAHLPGVLKLWRSGEWKHWYANRGISSQDSNTDSQASTSTSYSTSSHFDRDDITSTASSKEQIERLREKVKDRLVEEEQIGVRRALLESVMRLKTTSGVLSDMMNHLPQVPDESWESYCWTSELYNHPRMFLASLSRSQLDRVCCGRNCNMWQVLEKVRNARPVNGGSALDIDLVMELRALNFIFDPAPADAQLVGKA